MQRDQPSLVIEPREGFAGVIEPRGRLAGVIEPRDRLAGVIEPREDLACSDRAPAGVIETR